MNPFAIRCLMTGVVLLLSIGCGGGGSSTSTPTSPSANVPFSQTDLRVGTGTEAANGRTLTVHYTGWLYAAGQPDQKGRQFDSGLALLAVLLRRRRYGVLVSFSGEAM